ncbi:cation diffusion facilitator family transporter [Candidatus Berkiella aquae]|uniref:Cation diffusion facilitator family transporter n=2 Tax=Candidatus Berkiella aquae TaxID=295108 RepID=A0AAE3HXP7_9GAMM|nr:cation diffusion facilitator family transporter [Candidatus Berkiella aquae]MCS5712453.1 cation diffusion facilitator family transporter [Candidatus Berkiella aquae]
MTKHSSEKMDPLVTKIAFANIGMSIVVLGFKYIAFHVTGSVAFYSDAIESIVNVITAIAAFIAIKISSKPADDDHAYGHSKAEYLAALLEGILIWVASFTILREAYKAFLNPHPLDAPMMGIGISILATFLNGAWSWLLISKGRKNRSPALEADGKHLLTDVYTSGGVILGVLLVALTGWQRLDPTLASLVALHIIWSGWELVRDSINGLMDSSLPEAELKRIQETIAANLEGAIEIHHLRTREAAHMTFIDFHLVVKGDMSVDNAHEISRRIKNALKGLHANSVISIHIEPESKRKKEGSFTS